jgi:hypothetical protein
LVGSAGPIGGAGANGVVWTPFSTGGAVLEKSAVAWTVNASGLIAGAEFEARVPAGLAAVWQGTAFQAELSLLAGTAKATARLVDVDGTIAGWAGDGPLDEGGRPVVWRLTTG